MLFGEAISSTIKGIASAVKLPRNDVITIMCGRFTLTTNPAEAQDAFPGIGFPPVFAPRFNIAPSQPLLAIPNDGTRQATFFLWGFLPVWAKESSFGRKLINARAETLAEKPSFKGSQSSIFEASGSG